MEAWDFDGNNFLDNSWDFNDFLDDSGNRDDFFYDSLYFDDSGDFDNFFDNFINKDSFGLDDFLFDDDWDWDLDSDFLDDLLSDRDNFGGLLVDDFQLGLNVGHLHFNVDGFFFFVV